MPNPVDQHLADVLFQLQASLAEEFTNVLAGHFSRFEAALGKELRRETESLAAEAAARERARAAERLREHARRIARAESVAEWTQAVLDAAAGAAGSCALFTVEEGRLRCQGARNPAEAPPPDLRVALTKAPAFSNAVESGDAVVAVASEGELSPAAARLFRRGAEERAQLFPVLARRKCVAVLCAQDALGSGALLEAIAALAGLAYPAPAAGTGPLVTIGPAPAVPGWEAPDRERRSAAQRFARLRAAEMRVFRAAAVRSGRAAGDLYAALKEEIDSGREVYRRQFLADSPSLGDYFHEELVRILAGGQAGLLGPGYPGPLA